MNIVVLDACRDNPFGATVSAKGLAQMDAPPGTLLAYATAPGNVAEDGDAKSGNGLYTQYLVRELAQPAAKIEDVFKRVRLQVRMQSQGRQIPWESTSLEDDFYFDAKARPVLPTEATTRSNASSNSTPGRRLPNRRRAADFSEYLLKYPNGRYAELAQFKLDQLQTPKLAPAPDRGGLVAPVPGTRRYLVGDVYTYNFYENFGARKLIHVSRREVTFADDHKVLLNNGQWEYDQMGLEVRDSYSRKSPGVVRAPADIAVGKKWRSAYDTVGPDGQARHFTLEHKALARERIELPAGSFDTYRIESSGVGLGDGGFYMQTSNLVWGRCATPVRRQERVEVRRAQRPGHRRSRHRAGRAEAGAAVKRALRALALGASLAVACARAQAPVDLRVALVIGNAAYAAAPLINPANDAKAMGAALKGMGFTVIDVRDASKAQMEAALGRVRTALSGQNGVGLLYYAGHGLQLDWRNYMVPVDARMASAADVPAQTVDVQAVIDLFKAAGNRVNIVVLDACRDNPFGATASARGLAPMDAPRGTLLAYATAPGNVAEDGSARSGNGLYTQFLVQELARRATSIETLFKRVRLQVRRQSEGGRSRGNRPASKTSSTSTPLPSPSRQARPTRRSNAAPSSTAGRRLPTRPALPTSATTCSSSPMAATPSWRSSSLTSCKSPSSRRCAIATARSPPSRERAATRSVMSTPTISTRIRRAQAGLGEPARSHLCRRPKVLLNGGAWIYDQMGTETRDGYGGKVPGLVRAPADIALGRKWQSDFVTIPAKGASNHVTYEHKVVARESITVPAGTFDTYRIEGRGQSVGDAGFYLGLLDTTWADAQGLFVVKEEWRFSPRSGPPSVNLGPRTRRAEARAALRRPGSGSVEDTSLGVVSIPRSRGAPRRMHRSMRCHCTPPHPPAGSLCRATTATASAPACR